MVTRTNNPDLDLQSNCIVQVILPDLTIVQTVVSYEFFVRQLLGKSLNFMNDIPPNLLEFADNLEELLRASKTD